MTHVPTPEYEVSAARIPAEIQRFEAAVAYSRQQLASLKEKSVASHGAAGEEVGFLLDAHIAMLTNSRLLRGVTARVGAQAINAEAAIRLEIEIIAQSFAAIDDPYLAARVEDVRLVGARLIRNLTHAPSNSIGSIPSGAVLLADELSPADTALIDPGKIVGFATILGGPDSHTAIMARALGIPAVLGCGELFSEVSTGDLVLVDGTAGRVIINPSPESLANYEARCVVLARERRELGLIRHLPALTRDGANVALEANVNIERLSEAKQAVADGAMGIGLLRTEFLFMNRDLAPSEDEQTDILCELVAAMGGRPVTVRTLDVGGEKLASSLRPFSGESLNPALGLRAIRLSLRHRPLIETQFAAILRAGRYGNVRILLPMISSLSEVREARSILSTVYADLQSRGVAMADSLPPLGIMIEVPGAALAADSFASEVDFFAIGTNDLTQYTLAIDRGDEQVAHLYNPLHPAVLRLIQFTAEAAARGGIPVSICGEIAGEPRFTALLLGLGIRTLSMAPGSLLRVKQMVRRMTLRDAHQIADATMQERDERAISLLLERAERRLAI
jgi:phosphotransferase system enzyme I (PtsI)